MERSSTEQADSTVQAYCNSCVHMFVLLFNLQDGEEEQRDCYCPTPHNLVSDALFRSLEVATVWTGIGGSRRIAKSCCSSIESISPVNSKFKISSSHAGSGLRSGLARVCFGCSPMFHFSVVAHVLTCIF